jgi:OOP family OmpA-OmpF porin
MRLPVSRWIVCAALTTVLVPEVWAQQPGEDWTPRGYLGGSVGRAKYSLGDCATGFPCADSDSGFRVFTGAWLGQSVGLEASYVNLGELARNGGTVKAHGFNASVLLGLPVHQRVTLFGKVGMTFGWTDVAPIAPGVRGGSDHGLRWGFGAGAQFDLGPAWAIRVDWDRYRLDFIESIKSVSFLSVGAAYRF